MFVFKWRFFPVLPTLAINSSGENVIRNFQYGPPTQIVIAINKLQINSLAELACPNLFSTEVTNTKKPAIQGRLHDSEPVIWKCNYAFLHLFLNYSKSLCLEMYSKYPGVKLVIVNLKICQKTTPVLAVELEE